ncbi:uncharacterized protein cubi_00812 [Cryptosporidium ubiquitum]|uniref:Uncharacterized protein n=1 Tax=Cryptosporidium ubiquitum TaxID=857276 RepID=A0A1J4MB25_9CRYT|nr:uncharacterized protein cubi_00812 [Cryptosporidium ubiquitum]OII71434.1 hypothetical protein cubi_00812 [Cryptosporidium ubiquitum]
MLRLVYLFISIYSLIHFNSGTSTSIHGKSFLTLQSSIFPPRKTNRPVNLSLEEKHRLCLAELSTARSSLSNSIEQHESCTNALVKLQSDHSLKGSVCDGLKGDYDKYCKGRHKSPSFDKELCRKMWNNFLACLAEKRQLAREVSQQSKICDKTDDQVRKDTDSYQRIEEKCSKMEHSIYNSRHQTELSVIQDDAILEKPTTSITRNDISALNSAVQRAQVELKQCIDELAKLSERLAEKNEQISDLSEKISQFEVKKVGKKGIFGKKVLDESISSQISELNSRLSELNTHEKGLKKLLLSQEKECRVLETKLEVATERLSLAKSSTSTSHGTRGSTGCFGRFTRFVLRTCRRVANRFTRNVDKDCNNMRRTRSRTSETQF